MLTCRTCVMNDSIDEFFLDDSGKCNFCLDWDKKKSYYLNFTNDQENKNLENLKRKISSSSKNYDCIVGLSGGTDSSYVIYKLWKLGINPLVIHMDNGWNSSTSNLNISKILNITKFDYETMALNKSFSIMPEFLFFHELSGQGVLKYEDYDSILKKIPYKLEKQIQFDLIKTKNKSIPSAFIWLLKNN